MKHFLSVSGFALVLAFGGFGLSGVASAADGENRDIITGIIGDVISGAAEAEDQDPEDARCARLERRCDAGSDRACDQLDELCE